MAIFEIPDEEDLDPEWPDITNIRRSSEMRRKFADDAIAAGFKDAGIFTVPLRRWMIDKLNERRYQEKMVDTSLVARLVERTIKTPEGLHVVLSGDMDVLPGISTVVPDYSRRVILATTHPEQYDRSEAQSSFRLAQFEFDFAPIYLEQHVYDLIYGVHVYTCSNRNCNRVFVRPAPVPVRANPICKPCHESRPRPH